MTEREWRNAVNKTNLARRDWPKPGVTVSVNTPAGKCMIALAVLFALLVELGHAQEVRPYSDPSYHRLGIYAGGPDSYFDYHLVKVRLGEVFPNKKQFWAGLKANEKRHGSSRRHDIYFIYCGERTETLQIVKARVDGWLKPEPDVPTYPELIPAVCIGEENVTNRNTVLGGLARHIRETYGIPVFQS